ncbi:DUF2515 family protein [Paenibacillus sp. J2TS4]|uniref:DUF2515 family protein n=1 Tax=Paenibacillus sp. J2TS4 TaxID=2807194 RepID=UPI001B296FC4|nr:DUF2515 family protein [Paenibacillus sp. J2TS4]GIP31163.1 hypothetical protein J2TS4_03730 [Paenibacillus sp. J2TS4]
MTRDSKEASHPESLWSKGIQLGKELAKLAVDKTSGLLKTSTFGGSKPSSVPLTVPPDQLARVRNRWEEELQQPSGLPARSLPAKEAALVRELLEQTSHLNHNNVTRTTAYGEFYDKHPDVHWALLAHMVSRNGGWNMTDLRGDLLPRLLDASHIEAVFEMMERANALIFQDAYPQLLLYEQSLRWNRPLFHLLPMLHVSRFMRPVWELFWDGGSSSLLTIALIINEQNYIQGRVAEHPAYQKALDPLIRLMQAVAQTNQVVFPCKPASSESAGLSIHDGAHTQERDGRNTSGRSSSGGSSYTGAASSLEGCTDGSGQGDSDTVEQSPADASAAPADQAASFASTAASARLTPWPLYGRVMEHFVDLHERIEFGKQLYALLFGLPAAREGFLRFAREVPHTGSRADYWPQLFQAAAAPKAFPSSPYTERLKGGALREGASPLCSPELRSAWPARPVQAPERYDWFRDLSPVAHLTTAQAEAPADITREHSAGLRRLELAILARELID